MNEWMKRNKQQKKKIWTGRSQLLSVLVVTSLKFLFKHSFCRCCSDEENKPGAGIFSRDGMEVVVNHMFYLVRAVFIHRFVPQSENWKRTHWHEKRTKLHTYIDRQAIMKINFQRLLLSSVILNHFFVVGNNTL